MEMSRHLGCTGSVELGSVSEATVRRLEQVKAVWLDLAADPAALVVRYVRPDDQPQLREIAGELVDFLNAIPEAERKNVRGGALYCLNEETGEYVRLKVWPGGFLTVAWAAPDYERAKREPYRGQAVPLVFDFYQRLNGVVRLRTRPKGEENIQAVVELSVGLYPLGDFVIDSAAGQLELRLRDVNSSVVSLIQVLRVVAEPASSLEGEIDVSSFRPGDLEDYARFVFRNGEIWLLRPALWQELPATDGTATAEPRPEPS
jgi:hypothetical protein